MHWTWLGELKGRQKARQICLYVVIFLIIELLYSFFIVKIVFSHNIDFSQVVNVVSRFTLAFPLYYLLEAILEEAIFRFPLALLIKRGTGLGMVVIVGVAFSFVFGILHGSIDNIFVQGGVGLMFSILFLKCGGNTGEYLNAGIATIANHFLFNVTIAVIVLTAGVTYF